MNLKADSQHSSLASASKKATMKRLKDFDYTKPYICMVMLKRLPELVAFSRISDEAEPPKDAVSKMIWYNLGGGLR